MEISNKTAVLVDAKNEYTNQLVSIMEPTIMTTFDDMFKACATEKKRLVCFQEKLQDVPDWNAHHIRDCKDEIVGRCPWFSELLTAVFVSHVKVLTSVRLSGGRPNIKVKVPSCESFIHMVMVETARDFYADPYVFADKKSSASAGKRAVIDNAVSRSVRKMLPVREILQAYVGDSVDNEQMYTERDDEESAESDPDQDPEPPRAGGGAFGGDDEEDPFEASKTVHIQSTTPMQQQFPSPSPASVVVASPSPVAAAAVGIGGPQQPQPQPQQPQPQPQPQQQQQTLFSDAED